MNYEADDLLDLVDGWKFKLQDELETLTPQERAAFWQKAIDQAHASGLPVAEGRAARKAPAKRRRRATG